MPLYKGTTEIASGKLYKGTTEIDKLYKGTSLLYQNQIPFNSHFLIVGGGGSGGRFVNTWDNDGSPDALYTGGGGAGGVRTSFGSTNGGGQSVDSQLNLITENEYTITVGDGGTSPGSAVGTTGNAGGETSIAGLISVGGGAGGGGNYGTSGSGLTIPLAAPTNGGGGGGGATSKNYGSGSGTSGGTSGTYGFDGAASGSANTTSTYGGAGGGGASTQTGSGASGGSFTVAITGSNITVGYGGRGGRNSSESHIALTTPGQGGNGGSQEDAYSNLAPQAGNKGIVILRFPNTRNYTASGSPTLTTDGSDKILQWTTAGTYTITFT